MKEKKDFEWKKLKYYEGSKNGNFLKGLKHGVLSKNGCGCFLQKLCQKKPFF